MKNKIVLYADVKAPYVTNLLRLAGIELFDVREESEGCFFSVKKSDLSAAEKVLAEKGKTVNEVTPKEGAAKRIMKRWGIWTGVLLVAAVFALFSRCVTKISVSGNETVSTEEIEAAVKSEIGFPTFKSAVNTENLEKKVRGINHIGDASVQVEGNTVFVTVLEQLLPVETPQGDIVSLYDALITKVVLYRGECMVKAGNTVKAGEVLIADKEEGARGEVYGRVWFHENVVVPPSVVSFDRTGRTETVFYAGEKMPAYRGEFTLYETTVEETVLSLSVPLKVKRITYFEMAEKEGTIDFEAQKEEILQRKFSQMEKALPDSYENPKKWFFIKTVDKIYVLDLYYEVEIKISK